MHEEATSLLSTSKAMFWSALDTKKIFDPDNMAWTCTNGLHLLSRFLFLGLNGFNTNWYSH